MSPIPLVIFIKGERHVVGEADVEGYTGTAILDSDVFLARQLAKNTNMPIGQRFRFVIPASDVAQLVLDVEVNDAQDAGAMPGSNGENDAQQPNTPDPLSSGVAVHATRLHS